MKYNIEKINQIGKLLAEIAEEAIAGEGQEGVRIGAIEMGLRESLLEIGQSTLKCFLENTDKEVETAIECVCGGELQYQRRRDLKIVCWYEGELVPSTQRSVRQKDKVQRAGTVFRAKNKRYSCDIAEENNLENCSGQRVARLAQMVCANWFLFVMERLGFGN